MDGAIRESFIKFNNSLSRRLWESLCFFSSHVPLVTVSVVHKLHKQWLIYLLVLSERRRTRRGYCSTLENVT